MIINIINKIPVLFFRLVCNLALAQDSLTVSEKIGDTIAVQKPENNFSYKRLIAPTSLISIGAMSFAIPKMKEFDAGVRKEVKDHNLHNSTLDNYTQFIPAVMVYGFNISGLKGKHNLRERTIILAICLFRLGMQQLLFQQRSLCIENIETVIIGSVYQDIHLQYSQVFTELLITNTG